MALIPGSWDPKKKEALKHMVDDGQISQSDAEKHVKASAENARKNANEAKPTEAK